MRIKSALVLTAFSALAAWASCADATISIFNPPGVKGYCTFGGQNYNIGDKVQDVPENVVVDGKVVTIYHTIKCTEGGWEVVS